MTPPPSTITYHGPHRGGRIACAGRARRGRRCWWIETRIDGDPGWTLAQRIVQGSPDAAAGVPAVVSAATRARLADFLGTDRLAPVACVVGDDGPWLPPIPGPGSVSSAAG